MSDNFIKIQTDRPTKSMKVNEIRFSYVAYRLR